MSEVNVRGASPDNYQVPGRVSLWLRTKGSTARADWDEVGNITNESFEGIKTALDHFSNRRGTRAKDKSIITERGGTLSFEADELNLANLQRFFGSVDAAEVSTVTVHESKILANPGAGGVIDLEDTDLDVGTIIVRSGPMGVDEVTHAVGAAYTVDEVSGLVTVVGATLADTELVPNVHITWEKTVGSQKFECFQDKEIEVEAKFQLLTDSGVQLVFIAANAVLKNNGAVTFGDGGEVVKVPMQLECLVDVNGKVVTCDVIDPEEIP
jgi:hypothetical protein